MPRSAWSSHSEVGFGHTATTAFTEQRAAEQRTFDAMSDRSDVPVYGRPAVVSGGGRLAADDDDFSA
ncbi:MAG: putative oxidoreductase [Mycobacterium sp.]|jgi:hypothetical protein